MVAKSRALIQAQRRASDLGAQIDKLAEFITETVPGEPSQSEGAIDTVIRVVADYQKQLTAGKERYHKVTTLRDEDGAGRLKAEKARDAALEENDALRDRLHQVERDKAFLEGQLDRVREFDPVSDRDVYEDSIPSRKPPLHVVDKDSNFEHHGLASSGWPNGRTRRRWYHRERA